MKEQFKATRRQLIESMKALRIERTALKGLKGKAVSAKWDALTKQMDSTQDKIDTLSKALGYPVQERTETKRDGKFQPKHTKQTEGRLGRKHVTPTVHLYAEGKVAKGIVAAVVSVDEMPKDVNGNVAVVAH